jgi:GNAT superfamily N-acetyltransferase
MTMAMTMTMAPPSNDIVIRPYQPADVPQIKNLFVAGMRSLGPALYKLFLFRSYAGIAFWAILAIARLCLRVERSWLVAAVMLWTLGWWGYLQHAVKGYTTSSCEADLSDIGGVYCKKGGTFLVATTSTGQLVGIIAGEVKDDHQLELRRMSVSRQHQKKGIASKLVVALEAFANKEGFGTIFLICTSAQHAAHGLYKRNGFMLVKTKSMGFMGLDIYFFEKKLK